MSMKKVPDSLVIMGAGAIGVEFAYFYNQMGSKVTLVEFQDRILLWQTTVLIVQKSPLVAKLTR